MKQEAREITLVVDGIEVPAREGAMLVDAASGGDIEIPVFCYEPKLGAPVGACRMCLVEIEGIPKLQTACSTPVRDGMVVHTQTEQVKEAQNAVVEFLLVNHPLDCPVCDKGGECPLQDIAMGWGPGRSRFTDPKRHFQKPLPLSPQVRIDRERCILCYRCVRFSQEISEDEQLQLLERGDRSFVGTFDDRPYDAPFHGNIIELCPVGALTSEQYRFRARPWDIEDAGSVCTLCPSQCNVKFSVRDERVARVMARDNTDVDDGWLCDRGRFAFPALYKAPRIAEPMVRSGGELRPASWPEAIEAAADGLRAAGRRTAAIVGGGTSNEEGYLIQRILRGVLGSPHIDSRPYGKLPREMLEALARPELSISMPELDGAATILVLGCDPVREMPILDLRLRKARRRFGAKLIFEDEVPASFEAGAESVAIVWGRGIAQRGPEAVRAVLGLANSLGLAERERSGLLEVPAEANGRGLREVGCVPTAGPGFAEVPEGMSWPQIRDALTSRELSALLVANAEAAASHNGDSAWAEALSAAGFVLCLTAFENEISRGADVVFPAETHAEKEGTVTHPDGRLQRVRPGVAHPAGVRAGWQVLCELSTALGQEPALHSQSDVLTALAEEVPFYAGISNEEIGGRGVRWQEREAARGAVR